MELTRDDIVPANPLDLAGRTLVFTPDGRGGYSRSVRALAWEEDIGDPVDDNEEVEPAFAFDFAGRRWESFFVSRYGAVTFGEPYPFSQHGPDRWGTMAEIAEHLGAPPMIAALYKPRLGGWSLHDAEEFRNVQHVSRRPDRVVVTWVTTDPAFHVHGVPPQQKTRFQLTLHADGRIAFHYAPEPAEPDEAIRDGIVGLFPTADTSPELYEVFHHTGVKDHLVPIGCRVIETLGDEFDAFVFHGQFRYDMQFSGSWWGYYPANTPIRGVGFPEDLLNERKSPCGTRLRGQWGFVIWTRSDFVAIPDPAGGLVAGPEGTWHLAHEFAHTWTAMASYLRNGETEPLWGGGSHWLPELHTPSAFVRAGSIMGGDLWQENADGTFTRVLGRTKEEHGLSWLDLYLMGLATADEVTDTFLLQNLRETGDGWRGPHSGGQGNRDRGADTGRDGAARSAGGAVPESVQHGLRLPVGARPGTRPGPVAFPHAVRRRCARLLGSHHRRTQPAHYGASGPLKQKGELAVPSGVAPSAARRTARCLAVLAGTCVRTVVMLQAGCWAPSPFHGPGFRTGWGDAWPRDGC